jgi:hypothetical protein
MPLDVAEDDPITAVTPLCGLVVVKALNGTGEVCYLTAATEGLKSVECLGMARYAVLKLERGLTRELEAE